MRRALGLPRKFTIARGSTHYLAGNADKRGGDEGDKGSVPGNFRIAKTRERCTPVKGLLSRYP